MAGVPVQNDTGTVLDVALSRTTADVGFAAIVGENDDGSISGTPYQLSPEVTDDFRMRVGVDTLLDYEVFNYAAQNTGKHIYRNTTMTITWNSASGLLTNGSSITTTTTGVSFATQQQFSMTGIAPIYAEANCALSAAVTTNTTIDVGLFSLATTNPYAPTDGAYYRVNSTGIFGVSNFNGTEQTTGVMIASPTIAQVYKLAIIVTPNETHFYIDDVLYGTIPRPTQAGSPLVGGATPFAIRHAIAGGAAGAVLSLRCFSYYVSQGDLIDWMPAPAARSASGQAYQGMSGGTMGSLANYANSTNPTSAAGSNTATLVTGLGGQAACNATAGAATDFIFLSYQNPAGGLAQTPRNLVINGIWLSTTNMGAAVATTPTTVWWAVAFGHTAVSLATTEAATTKAPRRIPLGAQSVPVAAAIGAGYTPDSIFRQFRSPIVVKPGEFVALIGKIIVGTATASQSVWVSAGFDHYFI
jgi:hypothetical protein